MIVSDLSQIEPRVLAWLCGDQAMLQLLGSGLGPYEAHAISTMGWKAGSIPPLKKANSKMYALAKARVLALGYGAGWEKFIKMAMTLAGLDITEDDPEWIEEPHPLTGVLQKKSGFGKRSREIVKEFREQNPLIAGQDGIWKRLDSMFKRSVGEDFTMTLPSGRKMVYTKVRCEKRLKPNHETKKPEWQDVYTAEVGGKRYQNYGGKLTENITQAVARDVFGEHLIAMEDNGWTNLFSVHDEAVLEVDQDVSAKDVEHTMSKCPEWLKGCPIAAEAKEVEFYCK
jgi:DNA polymerase